MLDPSKEHGRRAEKGAEEHGRAEHDMSNDVASRSATTRHDAALQTMHALQSFFEQAAPENATAATKPCQIVHSLRSKVHHEAVSNVDSNF